MTKSYTADVVTDPETGEAILQFPNEFLQEVNWGTGTEIVFKEGTEGEIIMQRKNPMKIFAVETVSTFRHVYFIECEDADHAKDAVTMCEADTYFQSHLGELIVSARPVTNTEAVVLIRETEQPNMTLEELETRGWLDRSKHVVDYTK